jgi:hypothetical protein
MSADFLLRPKFRTMANVMHPLEPHPYGDFFALESWCSQAGLRLVCHNSIRLIPDMREHIKQHGQPRDETAAACMKRILETRFYSTEELLEEFSPDATSLWFSAATYISGLVLQEKCYMPSVGRLAAVAGFSPLSGVYGGISLYKWINPKLVRQEISLKGKFLDLE